MWDHLVVSIFVCFCPSACIISPNFWAFKIVLYLSVCLSPYFYYYAYEITLLCVSPNIFVFYAVLVVWKGIKQLVIPRASCVYYEIKLPSAFLSVFAPLILFFYLRSMSHKRGLWNWFALFVSVSPTLIFFPFSVLRVKVGYSFFPEFLVILRFIDKRYHNEFIIQWLHAFSKFYVPLTLAKKSCTF
jgi:hypothetical protein